MANGHFSFGTSDPTFGLQINMHGFLVLVLKLNLVLSTNLPTNRPKSDD